jgi:lysophospholipase L1-like esterase
MAEQITGRRVRGLILAAAALLCGQAFAQASADQPASGAAAPAALSGVVMPPAPDADAPHGAGPCAVPGAANAVAAPLTHVASHLRESRSIRVLAIGSSSTVGVGASSPRSNYTARLEHELEATFRGLDVVIVNRGVSGEMAAATARRLRTEVVLHQPDLVLWQVGTNDALARVSPDEFRDTLADTIRWIRSNGTDVVLVGLQYTRRLARDEHYLRIKEVVREVAAQESVPLVRRFEAMQHIATVRAQQNLLALDDFHLNDLGYQCMAEHIARAIVASIFVRPAARGAPTARAEQRPAAVGPAR